MPALSRDALIDRRYRVVGWIGQGACATVYEALDTELDRPVAIKILNSDVVATPTLHDRFLREAEAAMHIDSPFVVAVFDVGALSDGRPYIVMELLDGEDLGHLLSRAGVLEEQHAVELAIHALSGLAHAHARGVLHRDIKPDNLVIVRSESGDELLKIIDLGISKLRLGPESMGLTRTNVVLGSPVYMSPEQCRGAKHMDHRSDVYSVGVVLYECLTGRVPHEGDTVNELMFKIALQDAPDPRTLRPALQPDLAAITMKALAREVEQRFSSASAFREALLEWGAERGARSPPTPSSTRTPTPRRVRRLEVSLEEDDSDSAGRSGGDSTRTLVEPVERSLLAELDAAEPWPSRRRRAAAAAVVAAVLVAACVFVLSWGASTRSLTATAAARSLPAVPVASTTAVERLPPLMATPIPSIRPAEPLPKLAVKPVLAKAPARPVARKLASSATAEARKAPEEESEEGEAPEQAAPTAAGAPAPPQTATAPEE